MSADFPITDTTPDARRVQIAALRRMGMEGRVHAGLELNRFVREMSISGIRSRHPDYDETKVRLAFIRLTLGKELFRKVYGEVEVVP